MSLIRCLFMIGDASDQLFVAYIQAVHRMHGGCYRAEHGFRPALFTLLTPVLTGLAPLPSHRLVQHVENSWDSPLVFAGESDSGLILTQSLNFPLGDLPGEAHRLLDGTPPRPTLTTNYLEFRFFACGKSRPSAVVSLADLWQGAVTARKSSFATWLELINCWKAPAGNR